MTRLEIGQAGLLQFTLPLDVATQAMAIHGVRGKGKTVTATVIVEELLERDIQVVVIDPTDVWMGLKSSADGKRPGHDVVILGGPHGDLPLLSTSGAVIADFAVDRGVSLVLSLRHLRKTEQRRFVTEFAEQLFHRKGEIDNRTPLFLAIDEASQYCPQKVMANSARMVGAIQDIVRLGRSAGLGVALIDQRPASVNKDVLTQIELLVCHAVTSPQDRKALDEWIKQKDSSGHRTRFLAQLASLPRGEAWFWFPMADVFERVAVRMRRTFDSSRTPEIGESATAPEARAEVDLDELRGALAETIAQAEANDPKTLHRQIEELRSQLAAAAEVEDEDRAREIVEERDRYVTAAVAEQRARFIDLLRPLLAAGAALAAHNELVNELIAATEDLAEGLEDGDDDHDLIDAGDAVPVPAPRAREPRLAPVGSKTSLPAGELKILTAVAQHPRGVTREQLSILTAYKRSSRDTYLQKLRAKGLVSIEGRQVLATSEGFGALGPDFERLPTGDALRRHWMDQLPLGECVILSEVCDAYPDGITRELISQRTGYKRSSRDTYLQKLVARRLVEKEGRGSVRASDELFDGGASR